MMHTIPAAADVSGRVFRSLKTPFRRPIHSKRSFRTKFTQADGADFEPIPDYYAVLELAPDSTGEEIKAKYRALQKKYHPDVTGEEAMSAQMNEAYKTLSDPQLKANYDRRLSRYRVRRKGELVRVDVDGPGMMGPVLPGQIIGKEIVQLQESDDYIKEGRKLVVWIREWAKTFVFASDLPLPMPLQCDDISNGVRLAFITTEKNKILSVGELVFLVTPMGESNSWAIETKRVSMVREGPLPGEGRVMQAFNDALRDKALPRDKKHGGMFELTGLAAAAFAQFMPVLVTLPTRRLDGASYEAYHLKHSEEDYDQDAF